MQSVIVVLILILVAIFINTDCLDTFTKHRVYSPVDGVNHLVLRNYKDSQEAAQLMGKINLFTIKLVKKLKETYIDQYFEQFSQSRPNILKPKEEYAKGNEIAHLMLQRFRSESLSENEPKSKDRTSFTKNKGDMISLCLREKYSGKNVLHSLDILLFVMLHEIGHVITPEYNHTRRFWTNFKFLLEFCDVNDIYYSPDFDSNNVKYCSIDITYNPSYDKLLYSYFK